MMKSLVYMLTQTIFSMLVFTEPSIYIKLQNHIFKFSFLKKNVVSLENPSIYKYTHLKSGPNWRMTHKLLYEAPVNTAILFIQTDKNSNR